MTRTLPIPPFDKKSGQRPPPPAPPSLDGWARIPTLARDTFTLPACTARSKAPRFSVQRGALSAQIDGIDESATLSLIDLRLSSNEACIAGLTALLSPDRRQRSASSAPAVPAKPTPKGAKPAPAPASTGPVAFLRADLAGKRAEGGDRGVPPAAIRKLGCALVAKP